MRFQYGKKFFLKFCSENLVIQSIFFAQLTFHSEVLKTRSDEARCFWNALVFFALGFPGSTSRQSSQLSLAGGCLARTTNTCSTAFCSWNKLLARLDILKTSTYTQTGAA
jgi:hypothetical protein